MTDEKMAEEYSSSSTSDRGYYYEGLKEGFLDGLKAGRPQWHDLQKDPNDLPKVNKKVLLQIKDEDEPIKDFYRRDGVWNFANKYETIAWCEIPKYTEE